MKSLIHFLFILFIATACRHSEKYANRYVLPPDSMSYHLVQLALFESAHNIPPVHPDSVKLLFCPLDTALCSKSRFDSSLKYYCFHTEELKQIVKNSIDSLQKIKNINIK